MTLRLIQKQLKYFSILFCLIISISCQKNKKRGDDFQIFKYNESAVLNSLDPAFSRAQNSNWIGKQLFNGLVQLDETLKVQPDIAHRWEISDDGLTYLFYLREDVFFHQSNIFDKAKTRRVEADDVVFSLNRLTDSKVASPGSWILQMVESIESIDNNVVKFQLKKPFPPFLGLLTMTYASVIPREIGQIPNYDFRTNPIGTGPFYKKYWEENIKLVLRKNNYYHEKDSLGVRLPYIDAVNVSFLPDKQAVYLLFLQGKIDFVSGLDPSYKDDILTPHGQLNPKHTHIYMLQAPYLNTEYLGFRLTNKHTALNDIRVRQALNYGFDRKKLVSFLRNNMGYEANFGFIPMGMPGFKGIDGYTYQPQKAKELWLDFLKDNPNYKSDILLQTNSNYADIAEFLQREWQKININVKIEVTPASMLRQAMASGKSDFFRGSWIADYPDAENYLSLFYSPNFSPNGPNYTHFKSDTFDQLYKEASSITNDSLRFEYYKKMDELIIHQAPVIPLFYDKVVRFVNHNVSGLGINSLNNLELKRVKKLKK